jgi:F-type H+-transporting ATPase subunit delta
MAETSTIARPYAQAAFEIAKAKGQLGEWTTQLHALAAIAADAQVQSLIGNTAVKKERIAALVCDVAGAGLGADMRNFVQVLADNRRLNALPEIATQFDELRAAAEATQEAEVLSAFELDANQRQAISAALQKRLGRKVNLVCKIDPSLIGGAVIRAGDLVIDGSASGRLHKLTMTVTQ